MYNQVTKRDGKVVEFDISKIADAVKKAFAATDTEYNDTVIDFLALKVTADFQSKIQNGKIAVEDIQDSVETVLSKAGYENVAKAYILYRKNREKLRNARSTYLDYKETVEKYMNVEDWRVKENSTVTYSVGGLILSNSGAITANYWLSEVYDEEIANAHRNCELHLHDLSMLTGYCAGWSLKQLIQEGLGIPGKINSSPAGHLSTLCNQMVNFLGIMQNEWAGAQAFSSFDTYLAPFVKVDNLTQKEVKQCIQSFVFGVNTPSRWGTQAPFSNITLDWTVPHDLANLPAIVGGKEMDFTYGDCKKEMDMVNKAFIEIMIEGDANGRGFQYPIPTYSITRDFDWSPTENNKLLFEMTAKYGTPYFSNYINSDMEPSDVRSMCCRLRLDLRELRKKSGGFFGSGESTGSIGVVTINMPRIAYLASDEADFYRRLDKLMDIAARSLDVKRKVITRLLNAGLYPYTKHYLGGFENHFSTIGLVGMNEAGLNARWIGKDMTHTETQEFSKIAPVHAWQHPKNTFAVTYGGYDCGTLCTMHPSNLSKLDKNAAVVSAEIYLDSFEKGNVQNISYAEPSHFPTIDIDYSIILTEGKSYAEREAEKNGEYTLRGGIRDSIDIAVRGCTSHRDFFDILDQMDYVIDTSGKDPKIKHVGDERYVRFKSLGPGYSLEEILARVDENDYPVYPDIPMPESTWQFFRDYPHTPVSRMSYTAVYRCYYKVLTVTKERPNSNRNVYRLVRQDHSKIRSYSDQVSLLSEHNIKNEAELLAYQQEAMRALMR